MFAINTKFNSDLSKWNTGSVTSLRSVFYNARAFNGDVSKWNIGAVVSLRTRE